MTDWKRVQQRLAALGFDPGPIDGIRGRRTDAAIIAFKTSIGFRTRPYYGPLTEQALFAKVSQESPVPWFEAGRAVMGLHEERDAFKLRSWFDKSVAWIDPRSIPWCGAYIATCMKIADPHIALPENPLGARNWASWGEPVTPRLGSVMVFWRGSRTGWQGHVAFYAGEDSDAYHVMGGNQSDAVTITRIARSRLLASRWPTGWPDATRPVLLTAAGVPISTNEA